VTAATDEIACTIVSIEEILRGWLTVINRLRDVHRQLPAYHRLGQLFDVLSNWEVVPMEQRAADQFTNVRRQRIRISTMDLKIASIALVNGALLLTANRRDFSAVPGLRCENWFKALMPHLPPTAHVWAGNIVDFPSPVAAPC
jgi:tRNA(fMet)-specific endonuclease VapC